MYLQRQAVLFWSLLAVLCAFVRANVNITLEDTASQITYSPPACGLTLSSESSAGTEAQTTQICNSAWRIIAAQDASGGTLTTTSGPNNSSGGLIPQLFLSVRALALYVKTTANSTALVNVTVSTINPVVTVRSEINSSLEFISIVDLPEDRITTLSLTFVEANETTRLDIDSITVTISDNNGLATIRMLTIPAQHHSASNEHSIYRYTQSYTDTSTIRANQRCDRRRSARCTAGSHDPCSYRVPVRSIS
ncbi:hypothetical protein FKP32DRAFT_1562794 [Trametes sanguinea]|nr:hypothetical protein FKP32DRAFT_1562794 [Trametes sanguinea]